MAQVARARIGRPVMVVPQVTTGHDSKRADGRERARFRSAQGVLTVAIANDLPLEPSRQMDVTREHGTRVHVALACITVALRPTGVIMATANVLINVGAARIVARTATKLARIVILIAMSDLGLPPVVIAVVHVRAAATSAILVDSIPLIVAGVIVARIEIEHGPPQNFVSRSNELNGCV